MAWVGAVGIVTTFPSSGEKLCVGCEYWKGERDITNNGTSATSRSGSDAFCVIKKNKNFPTGTCSNFKKWSYLK